MLRIQHIFREDPRNRSPRVLSVTAISPAHACAPLAPDDAQQHRTAPVVAAAHQAVQTVVQPDPASRAYKSLR
jgi:hypothetical protein